MLCKRLPEGTWIDINFIKNWDLLEHPPKNEHKWTIDSPVLVEQILPGDHQEILDTTHPMTIPYLDITQPHFMCPNLCKIPYIHDFRGQILCELAKSIDLYPHGCVQFSAKTMLIGQQCHLTKPPRNLKTGLFFSSRGVLSHCTTIDEARRFTPRPCNRVSACPMSSIIVVESFGRSWEDTLNSTKVAMAYDACDVGPRSLQRCKILRSVDIIVSGCLIPAGRIPLFQLQDFQG